MKGGRAGGEKVLGGNEGREGRRSEGTRRE